MADNIARLKLDSGEFDSKIKRAVTGLQQMEDECRKVGGTLAILEKDQLDYVKALGQMQTVATTTKGKLAELTSAYTELRVQYNRLTDEEKKGDFGKALSSSLAQLKTRIDDTKKELNDVSHELGNTSQASEGAGSAVDGLTSILGKNITQLVGWGTAMAAVKAALDVAKDAFFATESSIDEWGRSLEGAKGAYAVLLDTLNGGNWNNFFQNLTDAITGARDLYDALDRVTSIKSNNQAAIAIVQAQIQQLRVLKQQGKDVDEQIKEATQRLKELQGQGVVAGKKAGKTDIVNVLSNYVNSQNQGGVSVGRNTLGYAAERMLKEGQKYFDGMKKVVNQYEGNANYQTRTQKYDSITRTYKDVDMFDITKLNEEQQKQYLIAKAITEKETELQRGIGIYAQAVNDSTSMFREEFRGNRYALQGSGGGGVSVKGSKGGVLFSNEEMASIVELVFPKGATESMNDLKNELARFTAMQSAATSVEEYNTATQGIKDTKARMSVQEDALRMGVSTDVMQEITKTFADSVQENMEKAFEGFDLSGIQPKENKQEKDAAKEMKNVASTVQGIAGGVSNIFSGVESLGVTIPNEIKGVISAVQGIATILSGIASVVTIIAALSAKPFARGGIVGHAAGGLLIGGNSYSGDNLRLPVVGGGQIAVNSGELILNRSQQNHLANALSQPLVSGGGGGAQPYVTGEHIFLGLNNFLRANGYGEIVTSH